MKKMIVFMLGVLLPAATVLAIDWTGNAGNSLWSDSSNWNPSGIPAEDDDVSFYDIPTSLAITGATGSLNSLYVEQNIHSLTLSGTGLSINSLTIVSGGFTANLPLSMPYGSATDCTIDHREPSQDAVFNQAVTIPDSSQTLIVSTPLISPTARVLFSGGLTGDGAFAIYTARVVLGAPGTYAGDTTVLGGGSLQVTNTTGSATGTGNVTLGESSQIGGTGTISGNVTCESSAMIGANLSTVPGSHVPLHIGGTLTLNSTAVNITSVGGATAGTYTLVQAASISGTPVLGSVALPSGLSATSLQVVGNEIRVNLTGSPIQAWRTSFGWAADGSGTNQGNSQDYDGDGYSNLMEYAMNTNPTLKSSVPRATASIQNVGGGNRLKITFTRHTARTDINYIIQASTSLTGTWTNIAQSTLGGDVTDISGGTHAIDQGTGTVRTVTVTDGALVSSNSKRFLRVQVVAP